MSWIYREFRSNRTLKFFLVHMVVSIAVGAMIIKNYTHNEGPVFPRYFITAMEAFFGSFGGAFLSLVLAIKSLFLGHAGLGTVDLMGHAFAAPAMAGGAALLGFLCIMWAMKSLNRLPMYFIFVAGSGLLMFSSYVFFVVIPNAAGKIVGL